MGSRWAGDREGGLGPESEEGFATYLACRGPQCPLEVGLERSGHTKEAGARPWGNLFVNWTQAG